jgi:hypothetical protein
LHQKTNSAHETKEWKHEQKILLAKPFFEPGSAVPANQNSVLHCWIQFQLEAAAEIRMYLVIAFYVNNI